jgi:ATP-binding cassette subfamily B protein
MVRWIYPNGFVQHIPLKRSSVVLRSFSESRRYWPHFLAIAILNLISMLLALASPLPMKIAVDSALEQQPLPRFLSTFLPGHGAEIPALGIAVGLLLAIAVLAGLQGLASWLLQTYVGEKLVWDFRAKLLNHVQRLPLAFHDHYGAGDSVYCIQHDAPSLQFVVLQGILPLAIAAFTLAGMILISVRIDLTISLLALAITPILFVLSMASSRLVRLRSRNVKELDSSAMSVVQEVLGFIRTIKAFGQEHREYERFVRHSSKRLAGQVRLARLQATFSTLIGLVIAAGTAAALYFGVMHVKAGKLTVGSLLVVMAYVVQMYQPLQALSTKTSDLQNWLVSLERTFGLLDQPPEIAESRFAIPLAHAQGLPMSDTYPIVQ